ncbi:unnamed protein product [Diamesa tonsa]
MTAEWSQASLRSLIKIYKKNKNMYDQKHSLYYSKPSRNRGLEEIRLEVAKTRPSTTTNDVTKKIQSLRTQYGQEQSKIEKSKLLDAPAMEYVPTIWWFNELDFIKDYMKKRSDSILHTIKKDEQEYDDQEFIIADFVIEEESEPPNKKQKKSAPIKKPNNSRIIDDEYEASMNEEDSNQTIQFTLVNNNELNESTNIQQQSTHILDMSSAPQTNKDKICSKRNKGLGKFVSSSMTGIMDDILFFKTQKEILNIIYDAQIKQVEMNNKFSGK